MSKIMNGRIRIRSNRDSHRGQSPYGQDRKRKSFTGLHSFDDTDPGYQSTPEYLRQLMNTSTSSNGHSVRNAVRRKSASEMTPRNNFLGNPKYKAQEDYYDEVQLLKKELKYVKDENSNMRAKIRRLEEDNVRKRKEIDNIYDTNKDGDVRRTMASPSTDRNHSIPTSNVVLNFKQRLFKLESQLKQREIVIDEMKNDPRWTKGTELEIQNRALFNELGRQKIERLNYIQQNDYMGSVDEEKKNAVRKLEAEKREFKLQNESLKKKVREMEKLERGEQLSPRHQGGNTDRDSHGNTDRHLHGHTDRDSHGKMEDLRQECRTYKDQLDHLKVDLKEMRRERDQYRDKFDNIKEDMEQMKREQYRKKSDRVNHDSDEIHRQTKLNHTGRSSPALKRDEEHHRDALRSSSSHFKRRDSSSSEERTKKDSKFHTPIRKSNEHIDPRSSAIKLDRHTPPLSRTSTRSVHGSGWSKEDDNRVDRFRKKHAARVIQRGWRHHKKSHKHSLMNKNREDSFDKRNSKIGSMKTLDTHSPRGSQQKLGSKIDNLGSGTMKNRPLSASISNDSALKIVQASLRGYINRIETDKTSRTQKSHHFGNDDEERGNERNRESFLNHSKQNLKDNNGLRNDKFGSNSRDAVSKFRRSPSPPRDLHRPVSPHVGGSKQILPGDRNKLGSGSRLPMNDRESQSKIHRSPSPPRDLHRPSSPHAGGSKQTLQGDRNKLGSGNRYPTNDREPTRRSTSPPRDIHRPSSPYTGGSKQVLPNDKIKFGSNDRIDRDDSVSKLQRPFSPSRMNTTNSKQSLKNTHYDADDF